MIAPEAHFAGHGEWADPAGVLMLVEVTSYDSDTDRRDVHTAKFGETVVLPRAMGIELDTEILEDYVR